MSIAPKKRSTKQEESSVIKTQTDNEEEKRPKILEYRMVRVLPKSFFDLPAVSESVDAFALVSIDTFIALSRARPPLQQADGFGPIQVCRFKRHVNPLSPETDRRAPEEEPTSKVIHSTNKVASSSANIVEEQDKPRVEVVTLRWSRSLSNDQVLLFNVKSIDEWEPWYAIIF